MEPATFNPTLVQFKQLRRTSVTGDDGSFNPTLVQFKPGRAEGGMRDAQSAFNPTLVQFKRAGEAATLTWRQPFNPTLVQFKRYSDSMQQLQDLLSILP